MHHEAPVTKHQDDSGTEHQDDSGTEHQDSQAQEYHETSKVMKFLFHEICKWFKKTEISIWISAFNSPAFYQDWFLPIFK